MHSSPYIDTETFRLLRGNAPILISIPHVGTVIPQDIQDTLATPALTIADTDWHLDRVYDFAASLGATLLVSKVSRYVIDLNRPPNGLSLYPGQNTTELCPTTTFRNEPLYQEGAKPSAEQVQQRLERYWRPYHQNLATELQRLQNQSEHVLLWDAHSIASELPYLFEGRLPDLNFGTNDGKSCDASVLNAARAVVEKRNEYSHVSNQRFKGGYITRNYGNPAQGVHAIQLEMAQYLYMQESLPFAYQETRAKPLQTVIHDMIQSAARQLGELR